MVAIFISSSFIRFAETQHNNDQGATS